MNATALAQGSMGMMPKYHDYKVYFNGAHKADINNSGIVEPIPCDADGNEVSIAGSEWVYSEYADSGGGTDSTTNTSDNYDVKFMGQHEGSTTNYTCVSLIEAYRQSRARPQTTDPVWPSDAITSPWMKLFGDDDQTGDVLTNLDEDNDSPPYDPDIYIGEGASADGGFTVGTGTPSKTGSPASGSAISSFVAPCGLIRVEIDDYSDMSSEDIHISFEVEVLGPMDM
jgi:hypothetical protein